MSGPWLRDGNTIYSLIHAGWRKGVEQFQNKLWMHVYKCSECSPKDLEYTVNLIHEAGTVAHETGLTPRQLAEQRAQLLEALKSIVRSADLNQAAINTFLLIDARAAIAKATAQNKPEVNRE